MQGFSSGLFNGGISSYVGLLFEHTGSVNTNVGERWSGSRDCSDMLPRVTTEKWRKVLRRVAEVKTTGKLRKVCRGLVLACGTGRYNYTYCYPAMTTLYVFYPTSSFLTIWLYDSIQTVGSRVRDDHCLILMLKSLPRRFAPTLAA